MDFAKIYDNYYLDLDKVLKLNKEKTQHVINMYESAITNFDTGLLKAGNSFFKTLYTSEYIKNFDDFDRNKKLTEILNKDKENDS